MPSSYGRRSKEYDWFKGTSKDNKKNPKNSAKTIWKFSKIFLMFSLFFFSMWGCVQVFVIKTNNRVGDGLEFYNSEDEISPRVTRFNIDKRGVDKVGDIYSLNTDSTNRWINDKDSDMGSLLADVQKQIKSEGVKMSDAFKGTNEYIQVVDKTLTGAASAIVGGMGVDGKYHGIKAGGTATKLLAHSSVAKTYKGEALTGTPTAVKLFGFTAGKLAPGKDMDVSIKLPKTTPGSAADARVKFQQGILQAIDGALKEGTKHDYLASDWGKTTAPTGTPTEIQQALAHNAAWINIFKYLGVQPSSGEVILNANFLTDTHYRPMVSWKQAWVRGVGPFYGLFVYPISRMAVGITNGFPLMHGWESLFAIIISVFILRIFAFLLTFKSVMQQTKQQELQAKKAIIDAKYANYKGNKQMESRKKQETAELYKKEGVSPLGSLGTMFITMPIFLSIWRVIGGVPHLKSTVWLGINFSATSYKELLAGEWQYLPLMLIAGISAAFSQIYPRLLTKRRDKNRINVHQKAAMKKNNKTQNIVMVVFVIMALIFSAGIQIYWIVGGVWQVIQATITHRIIVRSGKNKKRKKVKV